MIVAVLTMAEALPVDPLDVSNSALNTIMGGEEEESDEVNLHLEDDLLQEMEAGGGYNDATGQYQETFVDTEAGSVAVKNVSNIQIVVTRDPRKVNLS